MFGLQELFDKQIKELFLPHKLGVHILENQLADIGLSLTLEQRSDLETQLINFNSGSLTFHFSDNQLIKAGFSSEEELEPQLREVVEGLSSKVEKFADNLDETMQDLVTGVTDDMSETILQALEEQMLNMLEDQDLRYHGFAVDIQSIWGEPLDLLQGLIVMADESTQGYITQSDNFEENDLVKKILVRIHAKAIQITKEILTLLRNGFSDGAQARWRTLHELAVLSAFVAEHGQDVAERYINHEAIDIYKAAIQYNDYYTRLGAEEISNKEIKEMQKNYLDLLEQYGDSYKYDYGWAASALNKKKPNFRDIETSVDLDHYRPYYKAASFNIHANPAGVFSSLGLLPEEDVILSGASDIGLTTPALSTITSLQIITTTMLTHDVNIDFLVISKLFAKYSQKVEDAFLTVDSDLSQSNGT